jgi:hypothetical protein
MDSQELVKTYLHGRNLEHLDRMDEAVQSYETVLAEDFDSTGPYDRLIAIYSQQARHAEVMRVASAAIEHVKTHPDKLAWYSKMREEAERAAQRVPKAVPKRSGPATQ